MPSWEMLHEPDAEPRRARRSGRRALSTLAWPEALWATNRERTKAPRRARVWCNGCDRDLVSPGSRCTVCGHIEKPFVHRKDTSS